MRVCLKPHSAKVIDSLLLAFFFVGGFGGPYEFRVGSLSVQGLGLYLLARCR